jgi:CDP-paratose 2-epimerase
VSVIEAVARLEEMTGKKLRTKYVETNRVGDHICYISDLGLIRTDYPEWDITYSLDDIFGQLVGNNREGRP